MDEILFNSLSLEAKAEFVQKRGVFVDAEDYYSYRILLYTMDSHKVELLYDFNNQIISVEFIEKKQRHPKIDLSDSLDLSLGIDLSPIKLHISHRFKEALLLLWGYLRLKVSK